MKKVSMLIISLLYSSSCFSSLFEFETAIITEWGKDRLGIVFLENRKGNYERIVLPSSTVALCKADGLPSPQDGFAFMDGPTNSILVIVLFLNQPVNQPEFGRVQIGAIVGIHAIKIERNSDSFDDMIFTDDDIARMAGAKEADLKFKQYWGKKVLDCFKKFYKEKK